MPLLRVISLRDTFCSSVPTIWTALFAKLVTKLELGLVWTPIDSPTYRWELAVGRLVQRTHLRKWMELSERGCVVMQIIADQ